MMELCLHKDFEVRTQNSPFNSEHLNPFLESVARAKSSRRGHAPDTALSQ